MGWKDRSIQSLVHPNIGIANMVAMAVAGRKTKATKEIAAPNFVFCVLILASCLASSLLIISVVNDIPSTYILHFALRPSNLDKISLNRSEKRFVISTNVSRFCLMAIGVGVAVVAAGVVAAGVAAAGGLASRFSPPLEVPSLVYWAKSVAIPGKIALDS